MAHADRPHEQDLEDQLDWAANAEVCAVSYIRILVAALERGDAELGVNPSAWENTMAAVQWAMMEHVHGRATWPPTITLEDVERMRRLHVLGSVALSGGERSPELHPLALRCIESLLDPGRSTDEADRADQEHMEDQLDWAANAEVYAVGYVRILADALDRGDAELGVDPSAWENTMTAVQWAMMEHVHGRMQGPTSITFENVERMHRLHALGFAALSGGERSPELYPLALQCMESLVGPDWKRISYEFESHVRVLNHDVHPDTGRDEGSQ
ncbi:hypothetical protein [Sorangium sp. So ce1078]|uniref:hypothetical protein n=1 Tax=Sorangium sp. So ce1078 TaxID=3133329 RepID=UPI003F610A60